jgi:hypothetical protein
VNREYDFTGSVVVNEQVQLRAEFAGLQNLQLADDCTGAGRQFNKFAFGMLRTEAAIVTSANNQIQDGYRRCRAVVQSYIDFGFPADAAGRDFDVGFGFDGSTRRWREIAIAPSHKEADPSQIPREW